VPPPHGSAAPELRRLWVRNYRSLRHVWLNLGPLTVVRGPNGSGKSNLYRALKLMTAAVLGQFRESVVAEGGIASALWAGPRQARRPVQMTLGIQLDDFHFETVTGLGTPFEPFPLDPRFKKERVWRQDVRGRRVVLVERVNEHVRMRDDAGRWSDYPLDLDISESILPQVIDPAAQPELFEFRLFAQSCRFHDGWPTHAGAPARTRCISTSSPLLRDDGGNLAAVWQTILERRQGGQFLQSIRRAFPDWDFELIMHAGGQVEIGVKMPNLERRLWTSEISDGTLRFLLLAAALHAPSPPRFLALNEPETSLSPALLPIVAEMISQAAKRSQVFVVTHSKTLAAALGKQTGATAVEILIDRDGTCIEQADPGEPSEWSDEETIDEDLDESNAGSNVDREEP
jgi:predicted ATPase